MKPFEKHFLCILFALVAMAPARAQSMREVWLSMPDSLVGYLNKSKRIEAMDYRDMGLKLDVRNLLKGSTLVDTLTADFISVKLNKSASLQMKLLPRESDTLVCVVKTFCGPAADSSISFFTTRWQPVGTSMFCDSVSPLAQPVDCFLQRPDTMSVERFSELSLQFEPRLLSIEMPVSGEELSIELQPALPVPSSLAASLKQLIKRRNFKWNGKMFIEC